ncbi:UTP--glucose-1-phosphate uridylyltransferase GalU [Sneathiella chinensis]|uniref:UTP--glucose-1-phosphate uridylyltransferase n=1 Tax=Sneathiella chinensis TaxID=349750 RepID=A0ABQ5U724_9PROT|nr:UTP--glucose-1-phosphate uridylyltransferase GalU [Sneathiella chinensis]GLQ07709.1 UTP--glucose-1-phosphate uridylyltransferase [Sneathiella chinensis]
MPQMVRKAIFPVGGLGTRFLPATKAMPKEMLPVVDKPLIQYAVDEARAAGIEEFIFITGRGKVTIEDHFDHNFELESVLQERGKDKLVKILKDCLPENGSVAYIRQQDPLGLGHAVWCAKKFVGNEPFAVILADDLILSETPCLEQMMKIRDELGGGNILATMEVPHEHTSRYGIVKPSSDNGKTVTVEHMVEKPDPSEAPSNLAVIGRYILEPSIFGILENQTRGAGNEIQLTDAMSQLLKTSSFYGLRFEGTRFDCGDKAGFLKANIAFALEREDMRHEMIHAIRQFAADL